MNFSTDRDLLVLEPTVFNDVAIAAQTRVNVADGAVSGTTLTSATADFENACVEAGSVLLIASVAHEVLARTDAHTLTVSLPRSRMSDPAIPGPQGSGLAVVCRTFAPQAATVHETILRLLSIDPDAPDAGALTEDAIVSLSAVARLEALGTLERIYSSAVAITGDYPYTDGLVKKTIEYRRRFAACCARSTILFDADGDGHADRRVCLGEIVLTRV